MAGELRRQSHLAAGRDLSAAGPASNPEIMQLIESLPEACQVEVMKGFTGDLLQLSIKIQEIQATNIEFREHLADIAALLERVKQSGNRGYGRTTNKGPGGETTIEIDTGGGPVIRPVGGGCSSVLAIGLVAGALLAWWTIA